MVYTINPGGGADALENPGQPGLEPETLGAPGHVRDGERRQRGPDQPVERGRHRGPATPTTTSPSTRSRSSPRAAPRDADRRAADRPGRARGPTRPRDCGCADATPRATRSTPRPATSARRGPTCPPPAAACRSTSPVPTRGHRRPSGPNGSLAVDGPFGWGWTYSYDLCTTTASGTGNGDRAPGGRLHGHVQRLRPAPTPRPRRAIDATLTVRAARTTCTPGRASRSSPSPQSTGRLIRERPAGTPASPSLRDQAGLQRQRAADDDHRPGRAGYTLSWTSGHITS